MQEKEGCSKIKGVGFDNVLASDDDEVKRGKTFEEVFKAALFAQGTRLASPPNGASAVPHFCFRAGGSSWILETGTADLRKAP